ncbi:alpha/beta hydrolase [Phanerochaete sordida]|uniref:Alpha/beta hydrolase n=1 Tax=Phanerochaete sordida TaxID=48140 RepID=A0A9P3GM25_9APHY|nr:alpha/beta hydrolase [Phanerochaete sordida]
MRVAHGLSGVAASLAFAHTLHAKSLVARDDFSWENLASSSTLSWTPCYDTLQCTRFTVPLQYSNPSAGDAQLAVIMLPSNLSKSDPSYHGPLFINPGGPGESGVQIVQELGTFLQTIVGPGYDIVSFDPRAVGATTPSFQIFNNTLEVSEFYGSYASDASVGPAALGTGLAQARILGQLAASNPEVRLVAESSSTAAVASDMLVLARVFGYQKVNYWGFSFASMFPDNVGRFIIDGVVNVHEYYTGKQPSALLTIDAALSSVWDACVADGPSACAFAANASSAADISTRVSALLTQLKTAPVPVFNGDGWALADATVLAQTLLGMLYNPYAYAPGIVDALIALEAGDASLVAANSTTSVPFTTADAECAARGLVQGLLEGKAVIQCGDIIGEADTTLAEVNADYEAMRNVSEVFAPIFYPESPGPCNGWPLRGKDVFNVSLGGNTSTPILIVNNVYDPLTPLANARNVSASFPRSVVLAQNATGHTSLSGLSSCTMAAIGAYFGNGTLPKEGTVCPGGLTMFANKSTVAAREYSDEGKEYEHAARARSGFFGRRLRSIPWGKRL